LWGIGVGPGDAEWLTLKGLRILQTVPVVAFPQNNRGEPGMAYQIIQSYLQPSQILVSLSLPFVSDQVQLQMAWQQAIAQLLPHFEQGQDIVFLAEGDISFYSTFTYIARTLQTQAPWVKIEAVPGVCSPLAAAAALKIPLSIGAERIAILPALYQIWELEAALGWADVIVLMKVGSVFTQVWTLLQQKGLLKQAQLVEWVGWNAVERQEQIFPNLLNLQHYTPPYFSILIVRQTDDPPYAD
jgi:precorrin-2/cobalt-factor-2 C20-methyltransferase